jgi:ankyrin repeat protein
MASLKDLATPTEIRREIQNLRQGSDSYKIAYETAVQRIRGQSVSRTKLANKVLAWIVYAKRVLKASELRLMLGVEVGKRKLDYDFCPDVDMMVSVCAGLVTIDEKADTIRLVHYTAQTFFDNAKSTILPSAETEIAKICITYLSLKVFARPQDGDGYPRDSPSEGEEDEEPLEQHSSNHSQGSVLYDYAAQYWGVHAREAPDAQGDVMRFLSRKRYITRAYETATKLHGYEYWEASLVSVDGLHLAAMLGLEQAVKQILHARLSHPDVVIDLEHWSDHPDGTEFYLTPLTIAAAQNRSDIVEILLEFGATVGVVSLDRWKDYKGTTALHVASEKGFEVIIDMLLQADAKSHSQRSMGDAKNTQTGRHEQPTESTLCIGPQKSHDELERLLQQTPRPTVDLPDLIGWLSLCIASCRGFDKIVDVLLRYGANMNFQSKSKNIMRRSVSPLYVASENGHLAIVKTLLHHGSKVHGYNSSPLYAACANGHIDIAKILLLKGVNMNAVHKSHSSPLHVACSKGYIDIAEMLLQEGASVDAPHHGKYSPLYGAASNGYTEIVRMLLKEGANVNAPHHGNYSPLYGAAFNGHTEIVQILLQEGAKVNAPHHGQQSPLDGAASNGHIEISKLLLHHGSEVNPHDSQSSSCLHGASAAGHVEMVKMLLEHGASTHLGKAARQSPIHAAIEHGRLEVFNLLIRHGANPNQWRSIKTPLQFAMDLQQQYGASSTVETMIEQLRELGGKTSRELRLQETLQLMQERREKNARSAEQ